MDRPRQLTRRSLLELAGGAAFAATIGTAGCATGGDGVTALPDAQVVLGVSAAPGFAPTIYWPLQSPALVVYGSGRILRAEPNRGYQAVPLAYTDARVDRLAVARLVADAQHDRVLERDFGDPQVTDQGSTRVWLHGDGGEHETSIYAFSESMDEYVSWLQRRNRARLRDLLDEAPYIPDRVVVLELTAYESSEPATMRWPSAGGEPVADRDRLLTSPGAVSASDRCSA